MSDISLKQIRKMFIGKPVSITCNFDGVHAVHGICKDVKLVSSGLSGHFEIKLKKGISCCFIPYAVRDNFAEGQDPDNESIYQVETIEHKNKQKKPKKEHKPISVKSIVAEFAGTLNVGDIV